MSYVFSDIVGFAPCTACHTGNRTPGQIAFLLSTALCPASRQDLLAQRAVLSALFVQETNADRAQELASHLPTDMALALINMRNKKINNYKLVTAGVAKTAAAEAGGGARDVFARRHTQSKVCRYAVAAMLGCGVRETIHTNDLMQSPCPCGCVHC